MTVSKSLSKVFYFILCTLFIAFTSCKNKQSKEVKEPVMSSEETQSLPADFLDFYKKFHSDSTYQMAHIQFPLQGYPTQVDNDTTVFVEESFRWQADKWIMHRMEAFSDTAFTRKFETPMPMFVNEMIHQKNSPFKMFRRFYKRDNDWFLIYYGAMNAVTANEDTQ
jgi:hypothetical protein